MSQHRVRTADPDGRPALVVLAWDPPLQCFFLDVYLREGSSIPDVPAYSSLHTDLAFTRSLEPLLDVLRGMKIEIPPQVAAELRRDKEADAANKIVVHEAREGTYRRTVVRDEP